MVSNQYLNGPDELIKALVKRRDALGVEISTLVGVVNRNGSDLPSEPVPEWPDEAKDLHEEYRKTDSEISRRNSRRCSMQITRVKTEMNLGEPTSKEVWQWFRSRY